MEGLMVKIQIDGKHYEVKPGKNLLETCMALGLNVPHFCFHAALGSVGACRLCAVKKFKDLSDQKGRIVMSCMEPVVDGLIVSIEDKDARAFRAAILESLMTNHPHDCPVCDEGGECHLQDMTVMTGHNYRRFDFKKRTFHNQDLGPFIHHEMNRCIECYRCVRFYRDYAGGKDLNVFAAHNNVYFGRYEEGPLDSEFSGNLVEVCPTGVFTDKTLKNHYTRKWDLTNAPSICTHCSLGCNIIAGGRYGSLRRIMSRYHGSVNGYFICDRGRFGYEFVNSNQRILNASARATKAEELVQVDEDKLHDELACLFLNKNRIVGIGSPRASIESNYALSVLTGKSNFYHGVSKNDFELTQTIISILKNCPVHSPSLKEIEKADAVFILGEDLTNTAPMSALAVRQAIRTKPVEMAVSSGVPHWHDYAQRLKAQEMKSPVFIASSYRTKLDDIATLTYHASPKDIARLGFAVASLMNSNAPAVSDLDEDISKMASQIAIALKNAKNPVIISGIHAQSIEIIKAAANIAQALVTENKNPSLSYILPECNSMGLGLMEGRSFEDLMQSIDNETIDTLIILENDLYRRTNKLQIDLLFENCKKIIVLDHTLNKTTGKADIVLPVGTFAGSEGTFINNEGRAQRFYKVLPPDNKGIESWRQITFLMNFAGKSEAEQWLNFDQVVASMTEATPVFAKLKDHMPSADYKMLNEKIKRQTIRYSGRTAMNAKIAVSEPKPPEDNDSPLSFSMEGGNETPPSSLVPYYWLAGWNSAQSMNFYLEEPNGHLKGGDPGILLLGNPENHNIAYFDAKSLPLQQRLGEWFYIPVYEIFGSEELSSKAPAIAKRIPLPYATLNSADSNKLNLIDGELIELISSNQTFEILLRIDESLPDGIIGIPNNLPGIPYLTSPQPIKIVKKEPETQQEKKDIES